MQSGWFDSVSTSFAALPRSIAAIGSRKCVAGEPRFLLVEPVSDTLRNGAGRGESEALDYHSAADQIAASSDKDAQERIGKKEARSYERAVPMRFLIKLSVEQYRTCYFSIRRVSWTQRVRRKPFCPTGVAHKTDLEVRRNTRHLNVGASRVFTLKATTRTCGKHTCAPRPFTDGFSLSAEDILHCKKKKYNNKIV